MKSSFVGLLFLTSIIFIFSCSSDPQHDCSLEDIITDSWLVESDTQSGEVTFFNSGTYQDTEGILLQYFSNGLEGNVRNWELVDSELILTVGLATSTGSGSTMLSYNINDFNCTAFSISADGNSYSFLLK